MSSSGGVLDEARIVRPLPDAVVQLDDLDVTDLEFRDVRGTRCLGEGRPDELHRPVETEGGAGGRRRNHEPTT